ncbi:MAG TPA: hypothetical protein VHU92_11815 [Streptosporangiaceae bacterium]|jgi:photosystem II stability/assembly factor-like uncharacterized protein|nr:hypothetical protein [Streptosporangiaceae bacterium]
MSLTARLARRVATLTVLTAATGIAACLAATAQAAPVHPARAANQAPAKPPAKFKAASLNWLSASHGWLLGTAPCGKSSCTDVLATGNGGTSWSLAGSIKAPLATNATPPDAGVNEVKPVTASVGWAYGPALFRTANGGKTWTAEPVPGHGHQVLALARSSSAVYAVVSPCQEFSQNCKSKQLTFWRTASLTGTSWTRVSVTLPINDSASLSASGKTVYVVDPGLPGKLFASTDGQHFASRPSPCPAAQEVGLIQAVPTSATHVDLLCDGNPGFSKAVKTVYRSVNTGRTDTKAGTAGQLGIEAELAASPSGNLLVGAWSNGTYMYLNDSHKTSWSMVLGLGDGGAGWNDLAFTSSKVAWAVYGPVSDFSANLGQLYVTRDGGQHWKLVRV